MLGCCFEQLDHDHQSQFMKKNYPFGGVAHAVFDHRDWQTTEITERKSHRKQNGLL